MIFTQQSSEFTASQPQNPIFLSHESITATKLLANKIGQSEN
jgi:hypothetical protein